MYTTTGREIVQESTEFPSPGLPSEPVLIAEEHRAVLAYSIARAAIEWRPRLLERELGCGNEPFAILRIEDPNYLVWAPFSQEGLGQHPLAKFGLSWFSVFDVRNSPLIKPHPVLRRQHLVFQFEDSTLDVVCSSIESFRYCGPARELVMTVVALLAKSDA